MLTKTKVLHIVCLSAPLVVSGLAPALLGVEKTPNLSAYTALIGISTIAGWEAVKAYLWPLLKARHKRLLRRFLAT